jgi:hypothetical protein
VRFQEEKTSGLFFFEILVISEIKPSCLDTMALTEKQNFFSTVIRSQPLRAAVVLS